MTDQDQLVDFTNGKKAKTNWVTLDQNNNQTRIYFYRQLLAELIN